jgi:AraC family transcriptional regulator
MYSRIRERIEKILETYRHRVIRIDDDWPAEVQRAVSCIKDHIFDQNLSVKWLKKKCRINDNNFSGKFKFYVGMSPQKYYLYHRIEVAKKILTTPELKDTAMMHIALHIGFENHSSFSTTFKNYVGCTPTAFRDENF